MSDPYNPYAAPQPASDLQPAAAEWLGSPSVSLNRVATGLGMIFFALTLIMLAVGVSATIGAIAGANHPGNPKQAIQNYPEVLLLCGGAIIIGRLLSVVGHLFCLATPQETRARGLIVAAVTMMSIGIGCEVALRVGDAPPSIQALQWLLVVGSSITFLLYLRQLSIFIARQDLSATVRSIFIWFAVALAGAIVGAILIVYGLGPAFFDAIAHGRRPANPPADTAMLALVGMLIFAAAAIVYLVTIIRYLFLILRMRTAILQGNPAGADQAGLEPIPASNPFSWPN